MKTIIAFIALAIAVGAMRASETPEPTGSTQEPIQLSTDRLELIGLRPLMVTSINFTQSEKIEDIKIGSKIVQITFDQKKNQIDIYPTVTSGMTNLNIRVGNKIYSFMLQISSSAPPNFQRTYTFDEGGDDFDSAVASAAPRKPFDIDTVKAIKTIERARFDHTYRETLANFRTVGVGNTAFWNNSPVTLVDVSQFADMDLLVFKIEWANDSNSVLNLDSSQLKLKVANTDIPVTCSQQVSAQLFPGQTDTIWLFVQGYRLSPRNDWQVLLPPDAAAVQRLFPRS
jgi:hypothetical protein